MTPRGFVRLAWIITLGSLAALAGMGLLLWAPWNKPGIAANKTIQLYCAAGVQPPVAEVAADYRQRYGATVAIDTGGSGELLSRIIAAGGRGDLFISAEQARIDEALKKGLVAEVLPMARLNPVLVVNRKSQERLRREGKPVTGYRDLLRDDLKVVLAADSASIGRLSHRMLEALGIWKQIEQRRSGAGVKVSMQGTVNKVALDVRTGDNFVGIVWDSIAAQYPQIEVVPVPEFNGYYDELSVAVLTRSPDPTAALQFARYLTARDKGLPVLRKFHFATIDDGDLWAEHPQLRLSAGAMLKPGIDQLVNRFEKREGVSITRMYDGCGKLVDQMKALRKNDKPSPVFPDAYFSCDTSFMVQVQQWFDAATDISRNDIVLVVQKGNPKHVKSINDLTRADLRLALGHPANSALGKLTDDMLRKLGLHDQVYAGDWGSRIVHDDAGHGLINKLIAAPKSVDVAVVYRSNALATPDNANRLDIIDMNIPEAIATQPFAIAKNSQHRHLMQRLLAAIVVQQSADHFKQLGFHWIYQAP